MNSRMILLALLLVISPAFAISVENVQANPSDVWLGDGVNLSASCIGNTTPITRVYVDITGPGIILPSLDLSGENPYRINVPGNYFDRKGSYAAVVKCLAGENATGSTGFTISTLSSSVSLPSFAYTGNTLEIAFMPKKNDNPITSDITFTVMIENQVTSTIMPPIFDTQRGWLLRVNAPLDSRVYGVTVTGIHQGKSTAASGSVEIRPAFDFAITNIDKTSFKPGDNVTLDIRAMNNGVDVPLTTNNLDVSVGGNSATVLSIIKTGVYNVRFVAPDLSPGVHLLTVEIISNGTYTAKRNVTYSTTMSGSFKDSDGAPINGHVKFLKSGSLITNIDFSGDYSQLVVPDTYDVEANAADWAYINLYGANVGTQGMELKRINTAIDGLVTNGVYKITVPWTFTSGILKLKYDTEIPASDLTVFKCDDFNYNLNKCNFGWIKIKPEIVEGKAAFSVSSFTVFAVGAEDKLKVNLNFDKIRYPRKDVITLRGSTTGFGNKIIPNVTVRLKIDGTYFDHTVVSSQFGTFELDALSPEAEGNYSIKVTATKPPYTIYSATQNLEVLSLPSISVVFPGSVRVEKENRTTQGVMIVNKGQKVITDLKVRLNLENKYVEIGEYPKILKPGEELSVPIKFFAFADDVATTKSGTLTIESNEIIEEKFFGFTIIEKQPSESVKGITGFAIGGLPAVPLDETTYAVAFALIAFTVALLLKRVKNYVTINSTRQFFNVGTPSFAIQATQSDAAAYLGDVKSYLKGKGL